MELKIDETNTMSSDPPPLVRFLPRVDGDTRKH